MVFQSRSACLTHSVGLICVEPIYTVFLQTERYSKHHKSSRLRAKQLLRPSNMESILMQTFDCVVKFSIRKLSTLCIQSMTDHSSFTVSSSTCLYLFLFFSIFSRIATTLIHLLSHCTYHPPSRRPH